MKTERWLSHMYCCGELPVINCLSCGIAHILKYFSVLISFPLQSSHYSLYSVVLVINTAGWYMFTEEKYSNEGKC
jgi:hypothetical protein